MIDPKSNHAVLVIAPGGERFSATTEGDPKPNHAAVVLAPGGERTSSNAMTDPKPYPIVPASPRGPAAGTPAPATLPRPPALAATPDALGLLKALRRRWRIALALGLLLAGIVGAASWRLVPRAKYTARATLHVSTNPKYIIFDPKERLADYRTYQQTQVALARSRFVLADALKRPGVAQLAMIREHGDADEWLADQIKINFPGGSEVLEISLNGDHPTDLAMLVNAVVDSYLKLVVDEEQNERRARLEKLKELWTRYQDNLQAKRQQMRELTAAVGSNDRQTLEFAQQSKIQHRDMAEREQLQVKFELRKAEAELAVLEARISETQRGVPSSAAIDMGVEAFPDILARKDRIQRLKSEYALAEKKVRSKTDPSLLRLRTHLDAAQRELAATRAKIRPAIEAELRVADLKEDWDNVVRLRAQISVAKTYQDAIEKDIDRLQGESKTINRGSLDLSQQQDEIQIVSETARKIGAEVEAMEVELGAPSRIRVVDRAAVPTRKDELRRLKVGGAASACSFALVLLGISFWEFRTRRIDSVVEVAQGLGLRVVGALPPLPNPAGGRAITENRRLQSRLVESIDAARALILHAARIESIRVLMITSAVKGEGKTSLAWHLAASLARAGRRTLLIDCDLRSPDAHRLFDLFPEPGLSEILRGEAHAADTIQPTPAAGLHLIPAGRSDALAIQGLARDRLRTLLEDLRNRYDFVIVDSAPLLPVADSLPVSQVVDAVIFSILRDVSRLPMVHAAYERLAELGVRTLGAVVSGATDESDGYGYPDSSPAES